MIQSSISLTKGLTVVLGGVVGMLLKCVDVEC